MSNQTEEQMAPEILNILRARVGRVNGLYAGQLTDEEMIAFNELVKAGWAIRDYNHAGGILGLAKVKLL